MIPDKSKWSIGNCKQWPTIEEVNMASVEQLDYWWWNLPYSSTQEHMYISQLIEDLRREQVPIQKKLKLFNRNVVFDL